MAFRATPIEKLNDEISSATSLLSERDRVKAQVVAARAELSRQIDKVRECKLLLRKEERDFYRFDRLTLPSLIHGVLGTRDKKRREEYAAWQRGRQALLLAMTERDRLTEVVTRLQARASALDEAPDLLRSALDRKASWLRVHDHEAGGRLWELEQGEREASALLQKVERALQSNRHGGAASRENLGTLARQFAQLEEMRKNKLRRLRQIWDERQSLLFDGAQPAGGFAETATPL